MEISTAVNVDRFWSKEPACPEYNCKTAILVLKFVSLKFDFLFRCLSTNLVPGPLVLFLCKLNSQADALNSFQGFRELTKLKSVSSLLQKTQVPLWSEIIWSQWEFSFRYKIFSPPHSASLSPAVFQILFSFYFGKWNIGVIQDIFHFGFRGW